VNVLNIDTEAGVDEKPPKATVWKNLK
jgi:hypothetical protein